MKKKYYKKIQDSELRRFAVANKIYNFDMKFPPRLLLRMSESKIIISNDPRFDEPSKRRFLIWRIFYIKKYKTFILRF